MTSPSMEFDPYDQHHSTASNSSTRVDSARSTRSVYSIGSSLDRELLREISGRPFNALCDLYMLPADTDEHGRLDIQHQVLHLSIDSLYAFPDRVRQALAPSPFTTPAILDVGTGSGSWPLAMAEEFPYTEVVGLDLVPPADLTSIPPNCRFEVDDANLPMPHFTSSFNVVHCRSVEIGIKDFEGFLYEVALMLRIGGVVLISGGEMNLYGEDMRPLQNVSIGRPGFSWTHFYLQALLRAHENRGVKSGKTKMMWNRWIQTNPNFEHVESFDILIPLGPWQTGPDERIKYVGELMRLNVLRLFQSGRSAIVEDGNSEETVDYWIRSAVREQEEMTVKTSVRWRFTCARRRDVQWIPQEH